MRGVMSLATPFHFCTEGSNEVVRELASLPAGERDLHGRRRSQSYALAPACPLRIHQPLYAK
jgi:hypothetical protein